MVDKMNELSLEFDTVIKRLSVNMINVEGWGTQ